LVPLQRVNVKAEIQGAFATTTVEMVYKNPGRATLECRFTFPLEESSTLADFEAAIDEKVITTKVREKEHAKEIYDDAVASGKAAVLAERSENISIKLGNLQSNQTATIKMTIISMLEVQAGYYAFPLPASLYPNYKKHGLPDSKMTFDFSYQVKIVTTGAISNLIVPDSASIIE